MNGTQNQKSVDGVEKKRTQTQENTRQDSSPCHPSGKPYNSLLLAALHLRPQLLPESNEKDRKIISLFSQILPGDLSRWLMETWWKQSPTKVKEKIQEAHSSSFFLDTVLYMEAAMSLLSALPSDDVMKKLREMNASAPKKCFFTRLLVGSEKLSNFELYRYDIGSFHGEAELLSNYINWTRIGYWFSEYIWVKSGRNEEKLQRNIRELIRFFVDFSGNKEERRKLVQGLMIFMNEKMESSLSDGILLARSFSYVMREMRQSGEMNDSLISWGEFQSYFTEAISYSKSIPRLLGIRQLDRWHELGWPSFWNLLYNRFAHPRHDEDSNRLLAFDKPILPSTSLPPIDSSMDKQMYREILDRLLSGKEFKNLDKKMMMYLAVSIVAGAEITDYVSKVTKAIDRLDEDYWPVIRTILNPRGRYYNEVIRFAELAGDDFAAFVSNLVYRFSPETGHYMAPYPDDNYTLWAADMYALLDDKTKAIWREHILWEKINDKVKSNE